MEIIKIVILSLSSLMLLFVGTMRLINPKKTYAKNSGITLDDDVNLLNEIRGVSAVMLFGGLIILLGTLIPELAITSFTIAILIFLGFALGRLLSISLDGKPNKQIIQGLIFELVFSTANILCLIYTLV
ncbi:hypothetical protein A9Q86_09665 [Flavobacteriales bacterium 33_180_T64]|nr:hypothetical protein A9Q86_09665 [Flavobacteriales bacterium 33_180_T64]